MTNNIFYLIILLIFATLQLSAQERRPGGGKGRTGTKIKLSGKVLDEDTAMPLEYVSISLFAMRDSSLVTGGITDESGVFVIESRPGMFYADVEYIGYKTKRIEDIKLGREQQLVNLGDIYVASDVALLEEVEVRAEKSEMVLSLDKKVFNVGKDLANTGGSVAEILDNVPSVAVDVEGNVSLRGSGGVRILVDGRPSGLVGISSADGLRQIPANMIDKIEVVTNPSARYEAEGMAGIINIILKKDRKNGFNGSFDFNVGWPHNYGTAINLNYRKKKFNFFSNFGVTYRRAPGGGTLFQTYCKNTRGSEEEEAVFCANDTVYYLDQTREMSRGGIIGNTRIGLDYFLDNSATITTSFLYKNGKEPNNSTTIYNDYIFNFPENLTGITLREEEETEIEPTLEYALRYKKNFKKEKHTLEASFQYVSSVETEGSDFIETYFSSENVLSGEPNLFERVDNKEGEKLAVTQIDYVLPIQKDGKLEAGLRSSIRDISNKYELAEGTNRENLIRLDHLSNDFYYDENVQAAYLTYGNKIKNFSYQFGLRAEYSEVKTELKNTNEINDRSYLDFFPSSHLNYEFKNKNAFQLSYSRRITRPRFWYLNPFLTYSDKRNIFAGNPDLNPEYTHSTELSHIKYWDNFTFTSGIYYRYTKDQIIRYREIDAEGNSRTLPQNLGTENSYGLEFTFNGKVAKRCRIDGSVDFFRAIGKGVVDSVGYDTDIFSSRARLGTKITLFKNVDTQIRLNYRGPQNVPQGRYKARYSIDLAISKDIWKGKGTVTLTARDLMNTRKRIYELEEPGSFKSSGEFQWRSRQFKLNLNYRLNQKKKRQRQNFDGGGEF